MSHLDDFVPMGTEQGCELNGKIADFLRIRGEQVDVRCHAVNQPVSDHGPATGQGNLPRAGKGSHRSEDLGVQRIQGHRSGRRT